MNQMRVISIASAKSVRRAEAAPGRWALLAICLGYFMTILDTTVVNVALPDMQRRLGANVADLQWIVEGYALAFASLLLTAGALGDRLGNRRVFVGGVALFTLASAGCGLAPNLPTLQGMRVAQGVGAAIAVPASLALLRHGFAAPADRARAIGIWGGVAGVAAASGPVVGGAIVAAWSWRGVFLINLPVGVLAVALTLRQVAPAPTVPNRGLDLGAQIAGIAALGLGVSALVEASSPGWTSPAIVGALFGSISAALAFVAIERRARSPMLPLGLFERRPFTAASVVGLALNFGFYGQLFVISLFFQHQIGYSAIQTGFALVPETSMAMIASTLSGRVVARIGARVPIVAGLLLGGTGLASLAMASPATPYFALAGVLIAVGFGTAFAMPAMTAAGIEAAPAAQAGVAAGVLNASRQVGGAVGVALLGGSVGGAGGVGPGMRLAMAVAAIAFVGAACLAWRWTEENVT
jgi:DHA2 family methylenomycin A resistance protein-like MFS transporter